MGNWIKLDVDIVTNAKVGLAGEHGDRLYVVLLALHAKHGGGGVIPASRSTAAGLRIEAVAFLGKLTEKKVAKAIEDCASVGLIERLPDGSLRLCGFNESHMPECSRCHKPNPEPAHGNCPACRGAKQQQRQALAAARAERAEKGMPGQAPDDSADSGQNSARAIEGKPGQARADGGQALSCLSLPDRRGEERIGEEEIGEMDGEMDGGSRTSQDRSTDAVPGRTSGPSRPASAGSILRSLKSGGGR